MSSPAVIRSIIPQSQTPNMILDVTAWTYATFIKATSGIIVIGTNPSIVPTTSSNGILLSASVAITLLLAPSTKIFAVADTTVEVLGMSTQTLAFIPQLLEAITLMAQSLTKKPMPSSRPGELWPGYSDWVKKVR